VVKVTGSSNKRVSLAALLCLKPGCRPRLIYRVHHARRRRNGQRKGFTETGYARLLDAAHQQLGGPLVVVWDNSNTPRQRRDDRSDRGAGLADGLPAPAVCARAEPGGDGFASVRVL
jgi:hypothetical protein